MAFGSRRTPQPFWRRRSLHVLGGGRQLSCCSAAHTSTPFYTLLLGVRRMGWSSWYGFTQYINETMLREMGEGMVHSGLHSVGYDHIWLDDGWAVSREPSTGRIQEDRKLFPSGMKSLVAYIHSLDLKFGIYTSKGNLTCLGYQPTQPKRPGSCGFEQTDADVYAHEWQVDQVRNQHIAVEPYCPRGT